MKAIRVCLVGLMAWSHAAAEPRLEGRVLRHSGEPVARAQVRLFDLADLRGAPNTVTTDESGSFTLHLGTLPGLALPERFELGSNYPNPFNPSTLIPYQLPAPMRVRLEVFNLLGQRIATLVDREQPAGFHTAEWDATDAAGQAVGAGVYLYRLNGDGAKITRRMLLIDGQAGISSAGSGGPGGVGGPAAGGGGGETAPVYGLTVSGPGLVPYVDPAFRVEAGMAPVEVVVQAPDSAPSAKVASSGILGDVDNTGHVDFFDALLVALYSQDASIVMPNSGDISLGDVNADGQVDLSDAWLIAAYLNDPSDPSLPAGIGEAVGPAASLSPDPSTVTFSDDGGWHRFTVQAGEPVSVVVNPAGTPRALEITTRSGRGNYCPAEAGDDATRRDGQAIYLSGCAAGEATLELRRESDSTVLRTYTFEVTGSPADLVVQSVSVSDSTLTPGQSFILRATVRNQGTGASAATTLRWYRSSNRTISTRDTEVGTYPMGTLGASGSSAESIRLSAPSSAGTYYYGACVTSVGGERAGNNCSRGVRVIVEDVDTGTVTIPDANLRAAIEAALDKASGAPITEAELKALTLLEATNRDIRDLTGLEAATNLTQLRLRGNDITDITPLAGLTNLTELNLRFNKIEEMTPLASLTNLTWLDLNFNAIEDISPLAGLTNLTILRLGWNKIEDITPLAGLTNLTELNIGFNNITDKSVLASVLANLTNLESLNLQYMEITDISMLAGLTNLRRLLLLSNNIVDISPLAGLTNLTILQFANNDIADITPLADLTNLTELRLEGNYIEDIAPLAGLTNLTSLALNKNNISDVSPLAGLTNLTWLDLRFNGITDISPLAGLTYLTWLGLRGNPLNLSSIGAHVPVLEDRGATVQYDSFQEEGDYDIELVFLDSFSERDRRVLNWTARRWMAVIREDLPDYEFAQGWSGQCGDHSIEIPPGERIDDLRIYVISIEDGPLGWGGPRLLRETTHLPVLGCMAFDIERSNIPIIGLHEIAHVLGFGTIWDELGLFQNPPNGDQHFNGPLAIAAFDEAGGREYTGAKVPVDGGHWRISVFGQELMTHGGDLSAITIQSLADLGYSVDVTQADPYTLPSAAGKARAKISAALPFTLGDDPLRGRLESAEWMGVGGLDLRDDH